jgi:phosphocarrier protein HPr
MREGTLNVVNPLGLHARAAAKLVRLASSFKSRIIISRVEDGIYADAKSILSVLTLAAPMGAVLSISVEGEDEEEASNAVADLFEKGFGEL